MKNWTDKIINWNQLSGTEVQRLISTWGNTPEQIARYDRKHGFDSTDSAVAEKVTETLKQVKPRKSAVKKEVVRVTAKRQKHQGADGEVKFVEHRNLYVGFFGGRVVVTKRTAEACKEVLRSQFNLEV